MAMPQPTSTGAERLMTTREVSEVINVPVPTLRWWRHEGVGPKSFTLGRRKVVYKRSDVEAWLEAQYAGANDPSSVA